MEIFDEEGYGKTLQLPEALQNFISPKVKCKAYFQERRENLQRTPANAIPTFGKRLN